MSDREGSGAAAAGSSAPTDVSLHEFLNEKIGALDRHLTSEVNALRRETEAVQSAASEALVVAKDEAKERLAAHNGLIDQMRQQAQMFAPREALEDFKSERHKALEAFKDEADKRFGRIERFQSMLIGGMILISFVGIANLVKVWTG